MQIVQRTQDLELSLCNKWLSFYGDVSVTSLKSLLELKVDILNIGSWKPWFFSLNRYVKAVIFQICR